jgi:hypothetical protein
MISPPPTIAVWRQRLRENCWIIVLELLLVAAVFVADRYHLIFFSKTPYLLALGWSSLALRGMRWRDLGLARPPNWARAIAIGVAAGAAMEIIELFITQPLIVRLTGEYPDLSQLHGVVGNLAWLLVLLAGSWVLAAAGEELVWRGYVLNRLGDLLGRRPVGSAFALVVASVWFGLAHADQGITGIVDNTIDGGLLGLLYVANRRQLIVPFIAHGITDTIDSLLIYSGHYPGM